MPLPHHLLVRMKTILLSLFLTLLLLTGCGGGGSGTTKRTTPLVFSIHWQDRTRAINPTHSALSLRLTLKGAHPDGTDLIVNIDRGANRAGFDQTVTTDSVNPGSWQALVTCFSQAGEGGAIVGNGQAQVTIAADGTGLGNIDVEGTIASVAITTGQIVTIGTPTKLAFTCRDASGALVPVTPDSAVFSVVDGFPHLELANGLATGLVPGTATVQAKVDDATSPVESVQIDSSATITVPSATYSLFTGDSHQFTASVSNASNKTVSWSVQEGASGGTITTDGIYHAPSTAGTYHVVAASQYDPSKTAVITVTVSAGGSLTVYENDFSQPVGSEWSNTKEEVTPVGSRPFLGRFGKEAVTLSLTDLPEHSKITITYKLFMIQTIDGNVVTNLAGNTVGPDIWSLSLDGNNLLRTTFSNWQDGASPDIVPQSYPNEYGSGSFPARTGASENDTLGFPSMGGLYPGPYQDSVYDLTFTVPHSGSSATFTFSGLEIVSNYPTISDGIKSDESWGINSVHVTVAK